MLPSAGVVTYSTNGSIIPASVVYKYVHVVAPYNTVVEELTVPELFEVHQQLGTLRAYAHYKAWADRLEYRFNPEARIKTFSSGMKQRIKLGISLLDDRPLLLLDEPTSNLDAQGKQWFATLVGSLAKTQTLIIASNEPDEISLCGERIELNTGN